MRNGWIFTCIALVAFAGTARAEDQGLALGHRAPEAGVAMKGVDGKTTTIEAVAGKKGTLVIFTCNSCPWVKAWQERMVAIGNEYGSRGIGVIMINSNDPGVKAEDGFGEMVTRAKQLGMKFPYVVDATSDVARAFGATHTPEAYLFDAKGLLVYHGTIDDNARKPEEVTKHYLADALAAVEAGKSVSVAETKALGCSIKFRSSSSSTAKTES